MRQLIVSFNIFLFVLLCSFKRLIDMRKQKDRWMMWLFLSVSKLVYLFAAKHNPNFQTIGVLSTIPTTTDCSYWGWADSTTCEWGSRPHYLRRQRFRQQLLLSAVFCKISPVFSPKLCCLSHFRVSKNSRGNFLLFLLY